MEQARKPGNYIWMAAALLSLVFGSSAADELQSPVISIAGIHSPTISMEGAQLICSVQVENPNDVALPVSGGLVNLKLDGAQAARGRPLARISIPARSTRIVDLQVDLTSNAAAAWLPLLMGEDEFTLPYQVIGYVDLEGEGLKRVEFDESGNVVMTASGLVVQPTMAGGAAQE